MKLTLLFLFITIFISATRSSLYLNVKDNILSLFQKPIANSVRRSHKDDSDPSKHDPPKREKEKDTNKVFMSPEELSKKRDDDDKHIASGRILLIKRARENQDSYVRAIEDAIPVDSGVQTQPKKEFRKDPVLNSMKTRDGLFFRRRAHSATSSEEESSSSLEIQNFKEEWKDQWLVKKFEALNSSLLTGDQVNMVAARPWGVPCGDPNQHDMPWGSCMLPMECESEFRIYRGDYFCGRTQFVCCALQFTAYDMYQGFEASLDDTSFGSNSEDRKASKNSRETRNKRKRRAKKKRRNERMKRRKKIKRLIRKIMKEIQKILNRTYRNGTTARRKKTKQLKKFIKYMKKNYKKNRHAVRDIHERDLLAIDTRLEQKLKNVNTMNKDFMHNKTFRDIVVNGTVTDETAKMMIEAYPELKNRFKLFRRSGQYRRPLDDYDIEYGLLYY